MQCAVWTVFLAGGLAIWMDHGHDCEAQRQAPEVGAGPGRRGDSQQGAGHGHLAVAGASGRSRLVARDALTEQRYYLLQLFRQYGENGKLSWDGLRRLLTNLGLGQLQVVEIEHEGLGHDHVSHLDALDLQEKGHVHSHTAITHTSMLTKDVKATRRGPHTPAFPSVRPTTASTLR
ncbi:hypothetical protein scyTo_0026406 [Scyliorhinus torazame]|uniref:EF-hand domain-containing protein n=1 Tax=Scyliorhinus torazame TaxID=75743 RepID=A0A401QK52_SCYTO|nr:hypothetical protein [Scyliorhinus torazame]